MPVQACVAAGKPLLARQLTKINADSRIVTRLEATLVSLRSLHVSGLDGSACERAQAHNCTKLLQAMDLCVGGAFISAIGFALILFYFCPCVRCALPSLAACNLRVSCSCIVPSHAVPSWHRASDDTIAADNMQINCLLRVNVFALLCELSPAS